jgi:hypothetical protein
MSYFYYSLKESKKLLLPVKGTNIRVLFSREYKQGTLSEGEGSEQLTSSLRNLFCKKKVNKFSI